MNTLGMAAPGNGGPWEWRPLGMAAPGNGGLIPSLVFCSWAGSWLPYYLTSHILRKSREMVPRCLPLGVFTETPSPASVSFTIHPSSSLFRGVGFGYTGENSVVHHALSFHRGTTCR